MCYICLYHSYRKQEYSRLIANTSRLRPLMHSRLTKSLLADIPKIIIVFFRILRVEWTPQAPHSQQYVQGGLSKLTVLVHVH